MSEVASTEGIGHEVFEGLRELLPVLRERAQETEDLRRLPDESVKALQETGVFRLLQPKNFGGYEADPVTFYSAVKMIASACGSTGWVSGIIGVHNWHLALFPQQAQQDVWGTDSDTRISSSYAPMGKARIVEGGYRLTGKWSWSSGSDHGRWVMLGGPVISDEGKPVDFCTFLVPRPDYTVIDVWNTVGLRGTGSNDIVVEDAFIPAHHVLSFMDMGKGTSPGLEQNTAPLYKMPWGTIHPTTISAPIVGMAYGAYAAHVEHQSKRVRAAFAGEKAREDPFAKVRIAEAASDIDAAWRQLSGNVVDEFALLKAGQSVPMSLRLIARRDQVRATARSIASIDLLFENSGASALQEGTPIQRFWRDAHAGRVHAANDAERAYISFGSGEFGQPITDSMV
jgi:3-hydroxy-9,10-secoandrosta-1,3,5(10)-triene-9,17-dione monooxygenase